MANLVVEGIGDVTASFKQIAYIPDDVKKNMLNAEAEIIVTAQRNAAPRNLGTLAESIQKKNPLVTWDGGYIMIAPTGIHHKNKSGRSRYRNRGSRG
ncbi:MAG TPA: hypothetical protein PKB13_02710, partial [Clostridia bacterium]|nr:hypothetical protein [Clostridia bacterium]